MAGISTPTVDRILVALKATEASALNVVGILIALKAIVDRNVNPHCWQDSGSSENYGYRVKKVADPPEREILNVADPHLSQCGGPSCEGKQCNSLCSGRTSDGNVSYE